MLADEGRRAHAADGPGRIDAVVHHHRDRLGLVECRCHLEKPLHGLQGHNRLFRFGHTVQGILMFRQIVLDTCVAEFEVRVVAEKTQRRSEVEARIIASFESGGKRGRGKQGLHHPRQKHREAVQTLLFVLAQKLRCADRPSLIHGGQ